MTPVSRDYLLYYLVLYDIPKNNHFRELVPMTHQHPVLLQIIIANSALHMSNAERRLSFSHSMAKQRRAYSDALATKQRAFHLLNSALTTMTSLDADVALAVSLLFIEFELLDSGRNDWRHHINGARTIIERLCGSDISAWSTMSPLRSFLISNCSVFDILGSTLTSSTDIVSDDAFSDAALSLLHDAEGNHCSSFPAVLLQLIQMGARILHPDYQLSSLCFSTDAKLQQAAFLLQTASAFDPLTWATKLQPRSPTAGLADRARVASAHRGAVCIYLSHVVLSLSPNMQLAQSLESRVADVITQLTLIRPGNALFTATTWPVFIAGPETTDLANQMWVARRFRELWEEEPWGLIREALALLETTWAARRDGVMEKGANILSKNEHENGNWFGYLRAKGVDWLIL